MLEFLAVVLHQMNLSVSNGCVFIVDTLFLYTELVGVCPVSFVLHEYLDGFFNLALYALYAIFVFTPFLEAKAVGSALFPSLEQV